MQGLVLSLKLNKKEYFLFVLEFPLQLKSSEG